MANWLRTRALHSLVKSVALLAATPYVVAQSSLIERIAIDDRRIATEIQQHGEVMSNIRHLCDEIGPRVTGSPTQSVASKWAAEQFARYDWQMSEMNLGKSHIRGSAARQQHR